MKVEGVNGLNIQQSGELRMEENMDAESKSLQNQISNAQKQLQELSSKDGMSMEERSKKRQELLKTIHDLNNQLKQRQVELQKEKRRTDEISAEQEAAVQPENDEEQKLKGVSETSVKAVISADYALDYAQAQDNVASDIRGRVDVLASEIRLDEGRGSSVEKKQEELSRLEQKAQNATAYRNNILSDAAKEIKEAQEKDEDKSDKKDKSDAVKKAAFIVPGTKKGTTIDVLW